MYDPLKAKAKVVFYSATAFLFGLGIASGTGWTGSSYAMPAISTEPMVLIAAVQPALDLSEAFVNVSEAVTPSVVRIEVTRTVRVQPARGGLPLMDMFRDRDGNPPPDDEFHGGEDPGAEGDPEEFRTAVGGGSGFIVSRDGYILTNHHVIEGADEIRVFLSDRQAYRAELVGGDPFTDVAVIKIDGRNFEPMSFGDADDVRVGEWVVAIGNPGFGAGTTLDYSVTTGIVSAIGRPLSLLNRELRGDSTTIENSGFAIENFIQTDAVINPGNSGGPMVNLRGQVVGINSAIATRTGFYQGYGFAIPINLAERVMEDLIDYGRVRRSYLGVRLDAVDEVSAEYYGLPVVSGVEIEGVTPGGPAERFGMQAEDIVLAVDGRAVATQGSLQSTIARKRPGDRVELTIFRDGREESLNVVLGEIDLGEGSTRSAGAIRRPVAGLGLSFEDLDIQTARRFGIDRDGVLISDVDPNGSAFRRGMGRGMLLLSVNDEPIETARDARRAFTEARSGEILGVRVLVNTIGAGWVGRTYHVVVPD